MGQRSASLKKSLLSYEIWSSRITNQQDKNKHDTSSYFKKAQGHEKEKNDIKYKKIFNVVIVKGIPQIH